MNNMPYPFFQPLPQNNIYEELKKLREELNLLKERINKLENSTKKDYLKKDDSFHML